ncbi:MAG: DEAD/DEAH box helicase [Flavobacterium sp.]|nr:DEAD/DEAH box helicase [Pedobacter sp.]
MLLENLKLSKALTKSMVEAGFLGATEVQAQSISRIIGAQDLIISAPEDSGKTTSYILGTLMRLKFSLEEAPRVLILVPDKEKVLKVIEQYNLLNKNQTIKVIGLYADQSIETQINTLSDGADIVVATPDRARVIYLKLGLNLNKIIMFIVDDAELIVKKGLQLPVMELARSIKRCQHLIFTQVIHSKLHQMVDAFMNFPIQIEIESTLENKLATRDQLLYLVPDFFTKINLLNSILSQQQQKTLIFVNNRLTAYKLFKNIIPEIINKTAIFNSLSIDQPGFNSIDNFLIDPNIYFMIVAYEDMDEIKAHHISRLIHFEVPEEIELYLKSVMLFNTNETTELLSVVFSTDIELNLIKKIENAIGIKIKQVDLPIDLSKKSNKNSKIKISSEEPVGEAFHTKKLSNSKDFNYSSREKAKMNQKRKHK